MKKKGQGISINVLIVAAIALVVFVVVAYLFTDLLGKEKKDLDDKLDKTGDRDGDGVIDLVDKCIDEQGEKEFRGCKDEDSLQKAIENS